MIHLFKTVVFILGSTLPDTDQKTTNNLDCKIGLIVYIYIDPPKLKFSYPSVFTGQEPILGHTYK